MQIVYAAEGECFVDVWLNDLWVNYKKKLELVYQFFVDEQYWFAVDLFDFDANVVYFGMVKWWVMCYDKLK